MSARISRAWTLVAPLCLALVPDAAGFSAGALPSREQPVAAVCELAGRASGLAAGGRSQLRLLDWLSAGTRVEVPRGARVVLVFLSGSRYELPADTWAVLGLARVERAHERVRALAPLPPWPELVAPIDDHEAPGSRAAAIRLRGARVQNPWPAGGAPAPSAAARLCFRRVPRVSGYEVEVRARDGSVVFRARTPDECVSVPAGVLRPDATYSWTVRTMSLAAPDLRGEAEFRTLSADVEALREALARTRHGGDVSAGVFLALLDRRLGLLREARDGIQALRRDGLRDPALAHALADVERQLKQDRGH